MKRSLTKTRQNNTALLLLLLLLPLHSLPQNAKRGSRERPSPLLPEHFTLQFAGSIGLFSAGAGYTSPNKRWESDLLLGYVPESIAGTSIWTAALKGYWLPLQQLQLSEKVAFSPITTGLMLTYTFGDNYFLWNPDRYPKGYYTFSTAMHLYFQLGNQWYFSLHPDKKQQFRFYYEVNSSAEEIISFIQNRRALSPLDIFHLSIGVRFSPW